MGISFKNNSVITRKKDDTKILTYYGKNNVIYGYNAANNLKYGTENVCIGNNTGIQLGVQQEDGPLYLQNQKEALFLESSYY